MLKKISEKETKEKVRVAVTTTTISNNSSNNKQRQKRKKKETFPTEQTTHAKKKKTCSISISFVILFFSCVSCITLFRSKLRRKRHRMRPVKIDYLRYRQFLKLIERFP